MLHHLRGEEDRRPRCSERRKGRPPMCAVNLRSEPQTKKKKKIAGDPGRMLRLEQQRLCGSPTDAACAPGVVSVQLIGSG